MMAEDDAGELMAGLRNLWAHADPPPDDLAARVVAAIASADLEMEYELLRLVERSHGLVGARDDGDADVINLRSERLSVVLHVSPAGSGSCHLVGWVDPPQAVAVQVLQDVGQASTHSDESGRFEARGLTSGPTRLVLVVGEADDERPPWFATNTLEL
ncbi:MAG: hypothetical protein L0K86_29765 [Actinomycetia bacterium]|nr:hypothetical protein [Actinomycetes bacterium]